jgi:ABC-type transport system involved in cytochrome c biogenesis permease component
MYSTLKKLWKDDRGLGTLEILMIIAVLVAIAVVFRKWIINWINSLFEQTQIEFEKDTGILNEPNV